MSSVTRHGFDAWNEAPQVVHMQNNTSILDVALQLIISIIYEHIFNADIAQNNEIVLTLSGRAIVLQVPAAEASRGAFKNYDGVMDYDGIM